MRYYNKFDYYRWDYPWSEPEQVRTLPPRPPLPTRSESYRELTERFLSTDMTALEFGILAEGLSLPAEVKEVSSAPRISHRVFHRDTTIFFAVVLFSIFVYAGITGITAQQQRREHEICSRVTTLRHAEYEQCAILNKVYRDSGLPVRICLDKHRQTCDT